MQKIVKRTFDLTLAITVALVLAPLLLLLAMLIRIDTRGPALFIQDRLGLDGKTFRMFKFRTMVENAEQMGTGLFSSKMILASPASANSCGTPAWTNCHSSSTSCVVKCLSWDRVRR